MTSKMSYFHYRGKFYPSDLKNEHLSHSKKIVVMWCKKIAILPSDLKNKHFSHSTKIVAIWRQKGAIFTIERYFFSIWLEKWAFFTFEGNFCHMTSKMNNIHYRGKCFPSDFKNEHFSHTREIVAIWRQK